MTKRFSMCAVGGLMIVWTLGCAQQTPSAPTIASDDVSGARMADVTSSPTIMLMPDLTANPAQVAVPAGVTVLVSNQSGRYVLLQSNCSEFSTMGLQAGASRHSWPFNPAGKTCNYFAYKYPQKIFVGSVYVQ